ncbi:MAG TPA: hypothetical protein VFT72_17610 [Opitutaceae bacterium]|nr:hypothetical protein [Opitutaceae bacterium]
MAGPVYQANAWVLIKRLPSDSHQTLTVFSAEHGATLAIQRVSKKSISTALDLFDEASLMLEAPPTGQAQFIKEARLLTRHTDIGRTYDGLLRASAFASMVSKNPVPEESRTSVYELLGQAFAAFATTTRPDIVYLKSLYRFCRDEGYPLKQEWVPAQTLSDRTMLATLLNQPLAGQIAEPKDVARLLRRLEEYLRGNTEILLD